MSIAMVESLWMCQLIRRTVSIMQLYNMLSCCDQLHEGGYYQCCWAEILQSMAQIMCIQEHNSLYYVVDSGQCYSAVL